MTLEEYKARYGGQNHVAPGWDAIDASLRALYGDQKPQHCGTIIKHFLGGRDPIDGISTYQSDAGGAAHLHFCTYGFSALYYDEEAVGQDFSRFGFELTFRLKPSQEDHEPPIWVCNLIQNIARYVFESGKWFEEGHWIPANGPIRADAQTDIVGLMFVHDPQLPAMETPHGRVEFLQMVGLTSSEVADLMAKRRTTTEIAATLSKADPYLVTDLARSGA
ncbi:suppressor of fused domain protein [Caldimonas brevitalea]|uniref:Riboflavin biosynthesis protein n=1 Tax=Caldimonas brevitalea TaxID=413882 RepID=A0A0G3BR77_9BURK|nr:suppressor of fused domain protein [Caldimonas brevitalea]AKJ31927.1 riboflavin biosynthesis protein [Caldimonas brevitalea]